MDQQQYELNSFTSYAFIMIIKVIKKMAIICKYL